MDDAVVPLFCSFVCIHPPVVSGLLAGFVDGLVCCLLIPGKSRLLHHQITLLWTLFADLNVWIYTCPVFHAAHCLQTARKR